MEHGTWNMEHEARIMKHRAPETHKKHTNCIDLIPKTGWENYISNMRWACSSHNQSCNVKHVGELLDVEIKYL